MQQNQRPILWSIAGSDCSGGAGIQADIKTGHALGLEVCTLITANTVQNSQRLQSINPTAIEILQQQFDCLIDDKPPAAVKIGMLASSQQLDWLIDCLTRLKQHNPAVMIVCDPVIKASVGGDLADESLSLKRFRELLKLVDLVTPNFPEAALLAADEDTENLDKSSFWAERILANGCPAVLISGGHGKDDNWIIDRLFTNEQTFALQSEKTPTSHSHGSGCTLSTAMACFLAQGYLLRDAFIQAQAYINKSFANTAKTYSDNDYYGALLQDDWPVEKHYYPKVIASSALLAAATKGFPSLDCQQLGLYPVVDSVEWLEKLMPLDLEIIQLRLKNKTDIELRQAITQAVELAKKHPQCRLFINDYWQLAIELGAYGVHLGQEDLQALSIDELTQLQNAGIRLGISTHGAYEFKLAEQIQPSYLAIGAIFPTQTKDMAGQIQGVDNLAQILSIRNNTNMPIVAIGGITLDKAPSVLQTGVESIAVVTAITKAADYKQALQGFQRLINLRKPAIAIE